MAKGGEAVSFCAKDSAHHDGCEYFAGGGDVGEEVPADDLPETSTAAGLGEEVPEEDMPAAPATEVGEEVPADDLPDNEDIAPADLQKKMFDHARPNGVGKYETPGQQVATIAEGGTKGLFGPIAPWVEKDLLGVPAEDIAGRAAANPIEHGGAELAGLVAGTALPIGQGAAIASAAAKAAETANLAGRGAAALKGAIEGAALFGSDKASQAILGQGAPTDATNPYMALGANVVLGSLLGSAGSKATASAVDLAEKHGMKAAVGAEKWLAKLGADAESGALNQKIAKLAGGAAGSVVSAGNPYIGQKIGEKILAPVLGKLMKRPTKYAGAAVARWLTNGLQGSVFNMIDYANKVARGESLINNSVNMLFKGAAEKAVEAAPGALDNLRDYIDNGGIDQNVQQESVQQTLHVAEGGEIEKPKSGLHHEDHLAKNLPDQNALIQAAKGRLSQYLTSQRPQAPATVLPYDKKPDDRTARKSYDKALGIALDPLSVMRSIKSGTITPACVKHLDGMYPDLAQHLREKMTEHIVKDQISGDKPSFRIRQGMSLMLGTPISSEFTPQSIQAAQSVFASAAQARQPQPQQPKQKGSKAALTKSSQAFLSDDQARERRQQRS